MSWTLFAQLLAGLGVGGIIVWWLNQIQSSQDARGEYLELIANQRGEASSLKLRQIQGKAYAAKMPQGLTLAYIEALRDAYKTSAIANRHMEQRHDSTASAGEKINDLAACDKSHAQVYELERIQRNVLWHPLLAPVYWRFALAKATRAYKK